MNTKTLILSVALPTLLFVLSAQAHDAKEHMKDAKNPDCTAMKNMDHSKMDKDDPVMQAMMKKCMNEMHEKGEDKKQGDHEHQESESHDQHAEK